MERKSNLDRRRLKTTADPPPSWSPEGGGVGGGEIRWRRVERRSENRGEGLRGVARSPAEGVERVGTVSGGRGRARGLRRRRRRRVLEPVASLPCGRGRGFSPLGNVLILA